MRLLKLLVLMLDSLCIYCTLYKFKTYNLHPGKYLNLPIDVTIEQNELDTNDCVLKCSTENKCQSISWNKSKKLCKLHSQSPYDITFTEDILENSD